MAPTGLTPRFERLPAPTTEHVHTRHGSVRVLVLRPASGTSRPPVVMHMHGGGFALSGVSAGAKLAANVCHQLHTAGLPGPRAIALVVPVVDVTRTDRTSSIQRPAVSPLVQRFVGWAYCPDVARRREALASPQFDETLAAALPPTLILTAAHDTLAPEGAALAAALRTAGVHVEHHEYPAADHDFIAGRDRDVVRDGLDRTASFLGAPDA